MIATYRLQLGPYLSFADAERLVPYLDDLGISHLYLSPSFEARPGSTHGYDVVDPNRISEERGGEEAFRRLCSAGLGVILDIVPNHMATAGENPHWADPVARRRVFDVDEATGRHRRFFDIDELAGVRVEDPGVFSETHRLLLDLVREGLVSGVRADHVDGLADPAGYLERLHAEGVPRAWVEKILEPGEDLRAWPVEGTTGYDFLADAQRVLLDPAAEEPLTRLHEEVAGESRSFAQIAAEAKLEQAETTFQPELDRLRGLWHAPGLERAVASLPVYRTYVEPWSGRVERADREALAHAELGDELRSVLALERPGHGAFVTRFQQTTGAVMAKGVEDTAFYRYARLLSLNEVGGDPGLFALDVQAFHERNAVRAERFPRGLLAGSTHDSKRSADVRARISALCFHVPDWAERVRSWLALTDELTTAGAPDALERYLLFQTLVGAWPLEPQRLEAYALKAVREAKRNTSWVEPDDAWEAAVTGFCRGLYGHDAFRAELDALVAELAPEAERLVLSELLLRLTSPGVPDVYQGDELPYHALVDPDNRAAVDWERRRSLLGEVRGGAAPTRETAKLHLLVRVLGLRARRPGSFAGSCEPVDAGPEALSYRRGGDVQVWVPLRAGVAKPDPPRGYDDLLTALPVAVWEARRAAPLSVDS